MNRHIKRIIVGVVACCGGIILVRAAVLFCPWTLIPIKSETRTLSVALYSGMHVNSVTITLEHYIDGMHVSDYVLKIENGVGLQDPQSYELPELREGSVVVKVEFENIRSSEFELSFPVANDLYTKGLLVYFTNNENEGVLIDRLTYTDEYVYFVFGKGIVCHFKRAATEKWVSLTNPPPLRIFKLNEPAPYFVWDSGWEQNEWVRIDR